ncbi:hypothetical protein U0070_024761 [Myodes glareolus]|uniref:Uncharacterized protein n=1 Tax=Myodes glareolus TaxID=447135 RepID=A0AAW0HC32_MYOGA
MTETREPAETGGYASLEEDDEDLSPEWLRELSLLVTLNWPWCLSLLEMVDRLCALFLMEALGRLRAVSVLGVLDWLYLLSLLGILDSLCPFFLAVLDRL